MRFSMMLMIAVASAAPVVHGQSIEITAVPEFGEGGTLSGVVVADAPAEFRVATYLYVSGSGWWTKPTAAAPLVGVAPDGRFEVNVATGGLDEVATIFVVDQLPPGVPAEVALGAGTLPENPGRLARDIHFRHGRTLQFSGHTWAVKSAPLPVGPGSNRFAPGTDAVWVDDEGMHLTVTFSDGHWWSSEVALTESLGYGLYTVQTGSRLDILDANATFGAFTWDSFGTGSVLTWPFRELDIEDSRWGNPAAATTSQFVVQPYHVAGNLQGYTLPNLGDDPAMTRSFDWRPASIRFLAIKGHHSPGNFPPRELVSQFIYSTEAGGTIPKPGEARFRMNCWLNQSAPRSGQQVEVVVTHFKFTPLHAADFNADGRVDGDDFLLWQSGFGTAAEAEHGDGDADWDGDVDGDDFLLWQTEFGRASRLGRWQSLLNAARLLF